jgi:hypothetical protein
MKLSAWSISHQLPSGLVFDKQKGIISGTPTKILSKNKYVVTASNSHGSTQTGVYIAFFVACIARANRYMKLSAFTND